MKLERECVDLIRFLLEIVNGYFEVEASGYFVGEGLCLLLIWEVVEDEHRFFLSSEGQGESWVSPCLRVCARLRRL